MVKNFLKLASGTGVSQVINLVSIVYFANAVGAASFGIYSAVISLGLIFSTFSGFRLELALQIVNNKYREKHLFSLAYISSTFFYFVSLLVAVVFYLVFETNVSLGFIILSLTSIYVFSLNQIASYLHINDGDFKLLSFFRVVRTLIIVILQVFLLNLSKDETGLIYGYLIGNIVSGIIFNSKKVHKSLIVNINVGYSLKVLAKYKEFPKFQMPLDFVMMVSHQLPMLFIMTFIGSAQLGIYALATKLLQAPVSLLGLSLKQVLYHHFGETKNKDRINIDAIKFTVVMALAVALLSPVYYIVINKFFPLLLDDQWQKSLYALNILFPMFAVVFCSTPSSVIATMCSLQDKVLHVTLVIVFIKSLIMFIMWNLLGSFDEFLVVIVLISIAQTLTQMIFTFYKASNIK